MVEIINLEHHKIQEIYKILREEKLANKDDLAKKISNDVRVRFEDKNTISTLNDIKRLLKDLWLLKPTNPGLYHENRLVLVDKSLARLGMAYNEQNRRGMRRSFAGWEKEFGEENASIIGLEEELIQSYIKRYVHYLHGERSFIIDTTGVLPELSVPNFETRHALDKVLDLKIGDYVTVAEFVSKYDLLRKVDGYIMAPDQEEIVYVGGKALINRWRIPPPELLMVEDPERKCMLGRKHFYKIWSDSDDRKFKILELFFADMIQNPGRKPMKAVLLIGEEGAGKDIGIQYLMKMFHPDTVMILHHNDIIGNFNAFLDGKILISLQELNRFRENNLTAKLNTWITSESILINPKNLPQYTINSIDRLIISTNYNDVIKMNVDSRRWFVLNVSNEYANNRAASPEVKQLKAEYFKKLAVEMNTGGPEAYYHYLKNLDMNDIDIRALDIETIDAEILQEQSMDDFDLFVEHILNDGEIPGSIPDNLPALSLYTNTQTTVLAEEMNYRYKCYIKNHTGYASVAPGKMTQKLIKRLGLQWQKGKKDNKHFRRIQGKQHYVFPPLDKWE